MQASTEPRADSPPPAPTRPRLSRGARIALAVVAVLVALPLIALLILLNYDWDRARPWIDDKVSQAIQRPFKINGHLALTWEHPAATIRPHDRSWRDWIPWPHLVANDVHVGNPAPMPAGEMASVRQFSFSLNPLALLGHEIQIPLLRFDTPAVLLERLPDGRHNWIYTPTRERSRWHLDLQRVVLSKGSVHYRDALTAADLTARLDDLEQDPTYGVHWSVDGKLRGAQVGGEGKAGAVLSLEQQGTPYPVGGKLNLGLARLRAEGTLTKPAALAAVDLHLTLAGASLARLDDITGLVLPETPAFTTTGHLTGRLGQGESAWKYSGFKGQIGHSDIGGDLAYEARAPRGVLSGKVESHLLDFADLGPLVGADSNASKEQRGVAPVQPAGKVLPVEKFHTERWKSADADVQFAATRIIRHGDLPLSHLMVHFKLHDGVLRLAPVQFNLAGGQVHANITLDGSGQAGKNAIKAVATVAANHLQIKQLFPKVQDIKQATIGEINADAKLSATGDSVATMLAASNGELKGLVSSGTVSKLLLEEMGLNVGNIILTKLFGDKPVQLNCLASDLQVTDGLAQTRYFVVDTDDAVVHVNGNVNLASEKLDMVMKPETKSLRLFSLRAPLYVRGSFSNPDVSVDKGVLALKAGSAAALAAVTPVAALLPLINTGPGKDSPCAALLAAAATKPVAPPPKKK